MRIETASMKLYKDTEDQSYKRRVNIQRSTAGMKKKSRGPSYSSGSSHAVVFLDAVMNYLTDLTYTHKSSNTPGRVKKKSTGPAIARAHLPQGSALSEAEN